MARAPSGRGAGTPCASATRAPKPRSSPAHPRLLHELPPCVPSSCWPSSLRHTRGSPFKTHPAHQPRPCKQSLKHTLHMPHHQAPSDRGSTEAGPQVPQRQHCWPSLSLAYLQPSHSRATTQCWKKGGRRAGGGRGWCQGREGLLAQPCSTPFPWRPPPPAIHPCQHHWQSAFSTFSPKQSHESASLAPAIDTLKLAFCNDSVNCQPFPMTGRADAAGCQENGHALAAVEPIDDSNA